MQRQIAVAAVLPIDGLQKRRNKIKTISKFKYNGEENSLQIQWRREETN
jgi:hypothetical protein